MGYSIFLFLSLSMLLIYHCNAYPTGAGQDACGGNDFLLPGHTGTAAMSGASPYKITLGATDYSANGAIEVTLTGTESFKGFLLVATNDGDVQPIGTFTAVPDSETPESYVQNRCSSLATLGMGLTHTQELSSVGVNTVNLLWSAPDRPQGNVVFTATFVKSFRVYYTRVRSAVVWDRVSPVPTTNPPINVVKPASSFPPITVTECGEDKGCFKSVPCSVKDGCDYLVSWKKLDSDKIQFELMGANTGRNQYVALGIAPRQQMNDVTIIACQSDASGGAQVKHYYAKDNTGARFVDGIGPVSAQSQAYLNPTNKILSCRFRYDNIIARTNLEVFKDLASEPYNLFIARGNVSDDGTLMKHNSLPVNSGRVNLLDGSIVVEGGRVNYFIKAHAAIMILAWVLFGSIGVMLARYYKPMWTSSKSCGQKVWFSYHRALMLVAMLLTIVGFIMILIHKQGLYILPAKLPHKAHPILGLIAIICALLNPLLAAFRCKPDSKTRPLFNWFHWFFGTVAHIFAIVAMFLGMLFESVMIPFWLVYVLIGWVLFHVLCEIILEIHQCCMYDKNRDRTEEFQLSSAEGYGKGPEPKYAGRRFKCGILICYSIVTIVLAVVMTIIVSIWTQQGVTIFRQ